MPKIVIADDEDYVRSFLKALMEANQFQVVAEVGSGNELYPLMKKYHPDILLLDINMPHLTGMEFLEKYACEFPKTCIIILTSATSFKLVEEASEKGVGCFLRKDLSAEKIIDSIVSFWTKFKEK